MKIRPAIKCEKCGELFTPNRSTQRFCRKTMTRNCLLCGSSFETTCSLDSKLVCTKPECRKQASQVVEPIERQCKACGDTFTTIFYKQMYCKQHKSKNCPACGKIIEYICSQDIPATCGNAECQVVQIKQAREQSASKLVRTCKWCGKEFHPKDWRDSYCNDKHYKKCAVCGKQFEIDVRTQQLTETCSKECMGKLMSVNHDYAKGHETQKANLLKKYGVENAAQVPGASEKAKQTNLMKYGSEHYTQTDEYKERAKETNLAKYGTEWYLGSQEALEKRTQSNLEKYGVANVFQSEEVKKKIAETNLSRYGAKHVMNVPDIAKKVIANARFSKLEQRICSMLTNYNIEYIHQYAIKNDEHSHVFDFYLPKFKLLIDADGLCYHSYLDDPDGGKVREDYDEVRLAVVPPDHRFYLIVEGQEDNQMKDLVNLLESMEGSFKDYDSNVFKWCRSIEFPYPKYTEARMQSDFSHLCKYDASGEYIPQCRLGQSLIKNFHPSIYHARVGNNSSPFEGWNDDNKLKQVIRNRFIYQNTVDPSKVLAGFNVSKIAPCVSVFNPVLAKHLIVSYLDDFDQIVDPFSGYSGRLLGAAAANKEYMGSDLNPEAVSESNAIIDFLGLDRARYSIIQNDIMNSSGVYDCLLTCPPYYRKEIYNKEVLFNHCDDWIDICLDRFNCKRYVFVVDDTLKFNNNVVEIIKNSSHLSESTEKVIVIQK